jgi:hypothetical protein
MSDAPVTGIGTNVPMTVLGGALPTWASVVAVGDKQILPTGLGTGNWFVIVDLTTLAFTASVVSADATTVPSEIQPYLGTPGNLLVFTSMVASFDQVPQGALFTALKTAGAGALLDKAEQMNTTLGTGHFTYFSYILVATADADGLPGFEEFTYTAGNVALTVQLMPITVDGKTTYTPIALD